MKAKIFTLTMLIALVANINAQTVLYEQDFEGVLLMPSDIALFNEDGLAPDPTQDASYADSAWLIRSSSKMGTQIAVANSWHVDDAGPADDWMVLPAISLGASSVLSWHALSLTSSGDFPDDYQVLCVEASTSASDTLLHFSENGDILLAVENENYEDEGVAEHSVNLADKGFANVDVWIAFRLITPGYDPDNDIQGGSELGIDNIKVEDGATVVNEIEASLTFDVYPNPANDIANVVFNTDVTDNATVKVYDITGRMVKDFTFSNISFGQNNVEIDINNLQSGTYILAVELNNKVSTQKLMVQ